MLVNDRRPSGSQTGFQFMPAIRGTSSVPRSRSKRRIRRGGRPRGSPVATRRPSGEILRLTNGRGANGSGVNVPSGAIQVSRLARNEGAGEVGQRPAGGGGERLRQIAGRVEVLRVFEDGDGVAADRAGRQIERHDLIAAGAEEQQVPRRQPRRPRARDMSTR